MVIKDLSKELDEVEDAFYIIIEMKKASDLADAKEVQSDSTSSGDATPVHPREPRVSTCTNNPDTAFSYADFLGRPDTSKKRTSRGVQAQEADQEDGRTMSGQELARPTRQRSPPGVVVTAAATTAATDLTTPHEAAGRVTPAMNRTARRSVRRKT